MLKNYVYHFSSNYLNENLDVNLLGTKGANLQRLCNLAIPTPPGFTISSEICKYYNNNNFKLPSNFVDNIKKAINTLEKETKKTFGLKENPLFLSVRSGSVASMPGMMDTILNVGINKEIVNYYSENKDLYRFYLDCYRRFIQMFAVTVYEIKSSLFEEIISSVKAKNYIQHDYEMKENHVEEIIYNFEQEIYRLSYKYIPEDPYEQLFLASETVIKSWNSARANVYRKLHEIENIHGTAVNIQSMVFGNIDDNSLTGVVFSRNPTNGKNEIYGEYLNKAQGEDIVAGIRTPLPIFEDSPNSMINLYPKIYHDLQLICKKLESYFKDVQDIEFTVESGNLYILQTRSAKRTAAASLKIAYDLVEEGIISKSESIMSVNTKNISQILHKSLNEELNKPITSGLAASPGAIVGIIAFDIDDVENFIKLAPNTDIILVRHDTCPDDIKAISFASAIITARGGLTSHAAVVARGMGKPCICGINNIEIKEKNLIIGNHKYKSGDYLSIDGATGKIYDGKIEIIESNYPIELDYIMKWTNEKKKLEVRANAETVKDVKTAIEFGAEGVGLCRTEHMFFSDDKMILMQRMILETNIDNRKDVISKILNFHKKDFSDIFSIIKSLPINIRLLDPPLHEFLPQNDFEIENLSKIFSIDINIIKDEIKRLHEKNPMLGHRGCRLGITHKDIYEMQIDAIFQAAIENNSIEHNIEIMIPFISNEKELEVILSIVKNRIEKNLKNYHKTINYKLGTMIELPRAAIISKKLAKMVDFFSYGTNDLTQTTYGISRDDVASFMHEYKVNGIFKVDPFVSIDQEAVGKLIINSIIDAKKSNPNIKFGVCGEHAGDNQSINFFNKIGIDYISCSPYRIIEATISSAQSEIEQYKK